MKNLKAKLRRNGGFTLVEMLIVVAIIAILIMVSIPMVSSALERAKEATDEANERSAFGVAEVRYLASLGEKNTSSDNYIDWSDATIKTSGKTYAYEVTGGQGKLVNSGTAGNAGFDYGQCERHMGQYINVTIFKDGSVTIAWSEGASHNTYTGGTGGTGGGTP